MVVLIAAAPAALVQVSVYVELCVMPVTVCDPLVPTLPDHAPDAEQVDAFVEDHVNSELPPFTTEFGLALSEMVGFGTLTDTVVEFDEVPPAPVQVSTNFVVVLSATVAVVPLVASLPVHPPDAVQDVAFVAVQVRLAVSPLFTVAGLAVMVTLGVGDVTDTMAVCATDPPGPEHDRV